MVIWPASAKEKVELSAKTMPMEPLPSVSMTSPWKISRPTSAFTLVPSVRVTKAPPLVVSTLPMDSPTPAWATGVGAWASSTTPSTLPSSMPSTT